MKRVKIGLRASAAALALGGVPGYAYGTETAEAALQDGSTPSASSRDEVTNDIVVTARRREESLQKVPVAVSVIQAEEITARNIVSARDVATLSPGLEANSSTGTRNTTFAIRGQGASLSQGSGVATYFAEVPEFSPLIFDLQNVQVLKGPQGTLFGRVTTGGAVLLTPTMPGDELEGFVKVRVGSFGQRDLDFAATVPIIQDLLTVRLSGITRNSTGFTYNLYNNAKYDGTNSEAFRAIVKLDLGMFRNTTILQYSHEADLQRGLFFTAAAAQGSLPTATNPVATGNVRPIPASIAAAAGISCVGGCPTWLSVMQQQAAEQLARGKRVFNDNNFGHNTETEQQGVINITDVDVADRLTLRNIFSYREPNTSRTGFNSNDGTKLPIVDVLDLAKPVPRVITEEIQVQAEPLDSLKVTAGFFYQHSWLPKFSRSANIIFGGFGTSTTALTPAACAAAGNEYSDGYCHIYSGYSTTLNKPTNTDRAFFIQGDWEFVPGLTLTAGYRRTIIKRVTLTAPVTRITSTSLRLPTNVLPTELVQIPGARADLIPALTDTVPNAVRSELNSRKGTYTLALNYEINDRVLVYATTRTGYKPGGFNSSAPVGREAYGPETVTDYEVGVKTSWSLGGVSGRFNIDVFRDNYTDIQRVQTALLGTTPVTITANVAKARIQGLDIDFAARFSDAFDVTGFYTLTDAKYLAWKNTGQVPGVPITADLTQNLVANTSKHRFGITPSLHLQGIVPDSPDITLSGNVYYQSRYAVSDNNIVGSPTNVMNGRTLANLRLDWVEVGGSPFSLGASVINVTNNQSRIGSVDGRALAGYVFDIYNPPRSFYVDLIARF